MPDEIKPDESLDEQLQPESESEPVSAVANQPDEAAENAEQPEAAGLGEAEAESMTGVQGDESPADVEKSGEEADAEAAMQKMFENDGEESPDVESQPDSDDAFPDLSQVKMEETIANPAEFQQLGPSVAQSDSANNIDLLLDVKMPVSIELGRTEMQISDILTLGPGSVVELDKLAGEPVDLLVNDKIIAKGEVVVVDENFGVRITMLMSPEERLKSLAQQ